MLGEEYLSMTERRRGVDHLAPVETANLHQQVYAQLRQALMAGKFQPGEKLTLRGLAAAIGTSIMPARDAVLRLTAERALEPHGRSVRVPVMDIDRLEDVLRFRIALEGEAASLAAERATARDLVAIREADRRVTRAQKAGKIDIIVATNQEFHFAIYRAAHSDLLQSMIETLWLQIGPYLGQLLSMAGPGETAVDLSAHADMIGAIERGDGAGARAALAADLKDSVDIYGPLSARTGASVARQGKGTP